MTRRKFEGAVGAALRASVRHMPILYPRSGPRFEIEVTDMSIAVLIDELKARGVELTVEGLDEDQDSGC